MRLGVKLSPVYVVILIFIITTILCNKLLSVMILGEVDTANFDKIFTVYIPTNDNLRFVDLKYKYFKKAIQVKDQHLSFEHDKQYNIDSYSNKYKDILESCSSAQSRLCLIIEDDAIPINSEKTMKQRLIMNTLSLFTNEGVTWDCSKRGIGWLKTGITGNKSVCRIIAKHDAKLILDKYDTSLPADIALSKAISSSGIKQSRFLLVQHGAFNSIMRNE